MKCQTPGCSAEREVRGISHSVLYRERTVVVHHVPADVCTECGDAKLSEETLLHLEAVLRRKVRVKSKAFVLDV